MPALKRKLTEIETTFLKEAEEGHFLVGYEDDGSPFAFGAEGTANLFSVEVTSEKDATSEDYLYRPVQ